MNVTRIINNTDRLKNMFSNYGRNKNHLLNALEKEGFREFRLRTLADKSEVLLAYKPERTLADYAFRLYPDLSLEQKEYSKSYFFTIYPLIKNSINKIYANNKGEKVREINTKIRIETGKQTEKEVRIWNYIKDSFICKEEGVYERTIPSQGLDKVVKSYEKFEKGNSYLFYQTSDGTKNYIKEIDGIQYSFKSK